MIVCVQTIYYYYFFPLKTKFLECFMTMTEECNVFL